MYVLDSSAMIEVARKSALFPMIRKITGPALLITTSISMHELLAGVRTEQERQDLIALFAATEVLPYDAAAAAQSAEIQRELTDTGRMINRLDMLIGGICKARNAELLTLDSDFTKVKDLKVHLIPAGA